MNDSQHQQLPAYAAADVKRALLAAGVSGTVYSLVMPETEAALSYILDGGNQAEMIGGCADKAALADLLRDRRRAAYLSMYHDAWTQKQDAAHEEYFERWFDWASPVVRIDAAAFPFRYPTAGASEGIYKLMAEYAAARRSDGHEAVVHMFDGEYEGFPAYAAALQMRVIRHDRATWNAVPDGMDPGGMFWISQPSAIDGMVWPHFETFVSLLARERPQAVVIPDLTYVGSVACDYAIDLGAPNIPAVVISHSKPFGGYYQRAGGVLSRRESPSLFGNKWFKNLQSLAWAVEMMKRHSVFDLPRKYLPVQRRAAAQAAVALGIDDLEPADISLLAIAPPPERLSPLLETLLRGSPTERVLRLCLTPSMANIIDASMALPAGPRPGEQLR